MLLLLMLISQTNFDGSNFLDEDRSFQVDPDGSSEYDDLEEIKSCVPFYDLIEKHVQLKTGKRDQAPVTTFSLVAAYEYVDYAVITMEVDRWYGRNDAYYMSVTESPYEDVIETVAVIDRTMKDPKYSLSMCVKPMYGMGTKFLLFTEFIEHYKLQGVQYFYIYVKDLDEYTRKLMMHYVKSGEAEVVFFREEQDRPSIEWHLVGTQGYKTLNDHLPTLVFHNTSSPGPIGHTAKCVIDPEKVFLMWVHHVELYFPGYEGYEVPTSDAIIRHYRDINSGEWGTLYLPEVETFGPFNITLYPWRFMTTLYKNVKNRLDRVYLQQTSPYGIQ
ncbi:hypothetical protein RB195_004009 [Necator americanus]|uniref:Glycosyltransferase family 92 protein n=1 Tax=Necator americanus TaxID=51031 RepID=A0ABR1DRQ7_NECAM